MRYGPEVKNIRDIVQNTELADYESEKQKEIVGEL